MTAEERNKLDWIMFDSAAQSLVGMNGYEFIGRWACGALGEAAMLPGVWSLIVWLERAKPYVALANRAH